ncbi:hypothetical protein FNV43_RR06217 [Rhamnella rubrinervis]|uniref:Uncharacterized protein n=1 Tax=Rhamnella rubrinervis TaxID=2594499 RepID=A0A8K0HCK2_9ROSA|nr:hypothetical protein FNV43_RR06217 [Rhamnella rubrinervis]
MEEEKAAAYYDELTRKGEGAARFKQGLGFSNTTNIESGPLRGSALPSSSSSFLSNFVKASSPTKALELQKQAQLESIQNKLKKKEKRSPKREEEKHELKAPQRDERYSRRRSRSRESHRRRRSRSRERYREKKRDKDRDRRRSRSWSDPDDGRRRRGRGRSRSRSLSPQDRRRERRNRSLSPPERKVNKEKRGDDGIRGRVSKMEEKNGGSVDYSRLIEGYNKMSPAERIKAKMKLQLAETAEKDATKGMGSGWERFEFNKDAPLDDHDDHDDSEAAEDDGALVKHIGQSFRFSAVKAKREEQIKAAHDVAMFGASVTAPSEATDNEAEAKAEAEAEIEKKDSNGSDLAASLLSEKVLAKRQGSWRDRARGQRN